MSGCSPKARSATRWPRRRAPISSRPPRARCLVRSSGRHSRRTPPRACSGSSTGTQSRIPSRCRPRKRQRNTACLAGSRSPSLSAAPRRAISTSSTRTARSARMSSRDAKAVRPRAPLRASLPGCRRRSLIRSTSRRPSCPVCARRVSPRRSAPLRQASAAGSRCAGLLAPRQASSVLRLSNRSTIGWRSRTKTTTRWATC